MTEETLEAILKDAEDLQTRCLMASPGVSVQEKAYACVGHVVALVEEVRSLRARCADRAELDGRRGCVSVRQ